MCIHIHSAERRRSAPPSLSTRVFQTSLVISEGGVIRLETLIEFKFLNSCFSSSNFSIRGNSISVNSTLSPPYDLFKCPTDQIGRFLAVGETLIGEQYWWRLTRGIYIYIYMYIHTYIHTCTFIHIHTHSYTFIHIHTHIHIYTYTERERERYT